MNRRFRLPTALASLFLFVVVIVAGCGGGDKAGSGSTSGTGGDSAASKIRIGLVFDVGGRGKAVPEVVASISGS